MGFDAKVISSSGPPSSTPAGDAGASSITRTCISVDGMTCQSCVKNIEGNISQKPGVSSISVSLSEKRAIVAYNPTLTDPETIADQIDDMGFDAAVAKDAAAVIAGLPPLSSSSSDILVDISSTGSSTDANTNKASTTKNAVINIQGMTCHSCVNNIESNISKVAGVLSIKVSLSEQKGDVTFNPAQISAEQVAEKIDDMGFDAQVR